MDAQLLKAIANRLATDSDIQSLTQEVTFGNSPEKPEKLSSPMVVVEPADDADVSGHHGMAQDVEVEVKVWGYGDAMKIDIAKVQERIDEVMLSGFSFSDKSVARKFRTTIGWNRIPDTDPQTLHYNAQYLSRYFSRDRITAVNS